MKAICRRFFPGRRRVRGRVPAACLAGALLAAATLAAARPVPPAPPALQWEAAPTAAVAQGGPVSLEQAVERASKRFSGRVAKAETTTRGGRRIHEIRILGQDGRVRIVRIDAQTGQFL